MSKTRRSDIRVPVPRELGYLQILELSQRLTTIHKTQLLTLNIGIKQEEIILNRIPGSRNGIFIIDNNLHLNIIFNTGIR